MSRELVWKSATKLVKGFARGKFSPVEVVKACLAQIEAHDKTLNALCGIHADEALEAARQSEARWLKRQPQGPVDGVPVLVKALLLVRGWKTLRGSRTVDPDQAWDSDAPSVARLRESGAILLAQTTTPEFGWKGVTQKAFSPGTRRLTVRLSTPQVGASGA